MITIKVPGRICFFGDHQDYLQLPIIAGTINRYITLTATPIAASELRIALLDLTLQKVIPLPYSEAALAPNDYFCSALYTLQAKGIRASQGYQIQIKGDLPINAGLSSSSALVVAWIRFLLAAYAPQQLVSNKEIAQLAVTTEVHNFNQPGGIMDQFTIAQGGLGYLEIASQEWQPLQPQLGPLVVAVSGIKKQTLAVLQNARSYAQEALAIIQKAHPNFNIHTATADTYAKFANLFPQALQPYWYAAVENFRITKQAQQLLLASPAPVEPLGKLMNQHQEILRSGIQNTPDPMHKMMQAALEAGALGAKIIGSGGGGAMVALMPPKAQKQVVEAFKAAGAVDVFPVTLTPPIK